MTRTIDPPQGFYTYAFIKQPKTMVSYTEIASKHHFYTNRSKNLFLGFALAIFLILACLFALYSITDPPPVKQPQGNVWRRTTTQQAFVEYMEKNRVEL